MTNIKLNRDHNGKLHLQVGGEYAIGAEFSNVVTSVNGEQTAVIAIPLKHLVFGEVDNVVPFVRVT